MLIKRIGAERAFIEGLLLISAFAIKSFVVSVNLWQGK
jgi:hypothetical protein